MKRLTLATVGAMLAMPATALAGSGSGVVLSVDGKHRTIEVVDSTHVVHGYHYHGSVPKLHAGTRISFQRSGKAIRNVRAMARSKRSVAFFSING